MNGFSASTGALGGAAEGIAALTSRVQTFHRSADEVTRTLSASHAWGAFRPLREDFLSLAAEFRQHLDHMSGAVDGASDRLHDTASGYSSADAACLEVLAETGRDYAGDTDLRQLNPASRFYVDHRTANGFITSLPGFGGMAGSAGMDAWRFWGDLSRTDKYNVGTDIAMFAADASNALLSVPSDIAHFRADPLGFLILTGIPFLMNTFYWTKSVTDWLTGDPIATGQAAYDFDSIAQGCHGLATDLGRAVERTLDATWQGTAADAARYRLTALRNGIADTGDSADQIAALLQLVSSLITDAEAIVRGMITDVVTWAVTIWLAAQMTAVETLGASEAVAAERITAESARIADQVRGLMMRLTSLLRRVRGIVIKLRTEFHAVKERSFTALLGSSPGRRFMESRYGGGRQAIGFVRNDAKLGPAAEVKNVHLLVSVGKQTVRAAANAGLHDFGFHLFRTDTSGIPYPDGRRRIRILAYQVPTGEGGMRMLTNRLGVAASAATTVLPFGRAAQYWMRGGDTLAVGADTDRELDLWETPG